MTTYSRYIGIDYSGAETPESILKGLRVYCADGEAHECTSDSHPHDDPEGENEISKDLEDVPNEPRCYSEERSSCGCSHE